MHDFLARAFRANPGLDLVPFERLSAAERGWLAPFEDDPGFYGVLRPRPAAEPGPAPGADPRPLTAVGIKSVDRDTALLFLTLREAGPLPAYLRRALGAGTARTVARLVADGVLEVEGGAGFVSGAAALGLLQGEPADLADPTDPTDPAGGGSGPAAALSLAALRHGQELAQVLRDPRVLSERLYGYNRLPLTPDWKRRLAGPAGPAGAAGAGALAWLGLAAGGTARPLLDRDWLPTAASAAWHCWRARPGSAAEVHPGVSYKLYVSPLPAALPEILPELLAGLAAARAPLWKIGAGAAGLLRPDKIVAYFPDLEALLHGAEQLRGRLTGAPAQGVPFTAAAGGDGLLSWGVDPPAPAQSPLWQGRESWRFWLTNRLARALLAARRAVELEAGPAAEPAANGVEPWRFALARLRLEGVDVTTWTPGAAMFTGADSGPGGEGETKESAWP
jgi:hypothetical protein